MFVIFLMSAVAHVSIAQSQGLRQTNANDFWPKTVSGSTFNELWTYQFFLEDDIEITIVYSVSGFGALKSPVSGARLSVVGLTDKTYQVMREYPIERLVLDGDTYTIRLHQNREFYFGGKLPERHFVTFATTKDDIRYDIRLEFSDIQQGFTTPDGTFTIDGHRIGLITHIPYAKVRGTVSVNGNQRTVSGTAVMDHTFQNQIATKFLKDGFRYVYHQDAKNWELGHYVSTNQRNDRDVGGFTLRQVNGETQLTEVSRINRSAFQSISGYSVPRNLRIENRDGTINTLTRVRDTEKFPLFQELGRIARRAARTFMGGEIVEFRGSAELSKTKETVGAHYYFFVID